jgi:GDP-mannose 6-dehydrogenase
MRISVLGIGYVGVVSAACLAAEGHFVSAVDIASQKIEALNNGRSPITEVGLDDLIRAGVQSGRLSATVDLEKVVQSADVSIICVGTPSLADGSLNLNDVVRVCQSLGQALQRQSTFHLIVLRSTVLPGSTREVVIPILERASGKSAGKDFGVAFYPEFMREGSAIADYKQPGIVVFGTEDDRSEMLLRHLAKPIVEGITVTNYESAEAIKYACNAWHATKITFANEIGNFCKCFDIDSHQVMDVLTMDTRLNISPAYLRPGFAYGGSCLPKDLRALQHVARSKGLSLPLLEALPLSNAAQIRRAFDIIQSVGNRRVGLLGLSFKSGTDDLRESPAVELARLLHQAGYDLEIFDPNVRLSSLTGSNLSYIQSRLPHLDQWLTSDFSRVVSFGETLVAATRDLDLSSLSSLRADQVLIDLVRLDSSICRAERYYGLCW